MAQGARADGQVAATDRERYELVMIAGGITWDAANADAVSRGGHLVTITSEAENAGLVQRFDASIDAFVWIGASDAEKEGEWLWATGPEKGTPLVYTKWGVAEPNNANGLEHVAVLNLGPRSPGGTATGEWGDTKGFLRFPGYILERDPAPPVLSGVTVEPAEISPAITGSTEVVITVHATDAISGVAAIEIFLDDPGSDDAKVGKGANLSFPRLLDATATFRVTFDAGASVGLWELSGRVRDAAGNELAFDSSTPDVAAGPTVIGSCDDKKVTERTGPYERIAFGAMPSDWPFYELGVTADEVRAVQQQMEEFNGWDRILRDEDKRFRDAYCRAVAYREAARKGSAEAALLLDETRAIMADEIVKVLDPRLKRLERMRQAVEQELADERYSGLLAAIQRADARDKELKESEVADQLELGKKVIDSFLEIVEYVVTGTLKLTFLRVAEFANDLVSIYEDVGTILEILEEDAAFKSVGPAFGELISMRLELGLLIHQYEQVRAEQDRLHTRTYLP